MRAARFDAEAKRLDVQDVPIPEPAPHEVLVRVQCDRVLVQDTGPGIKPEHAERLFERGVRGEGEVVKGAGLGLAIVRRLCELYGWRVSLAPRAERGAVATLDFQQKQGAGGG